MIQHGRSLVFFCLFLLLAPHAWGANKGDVDGSGQIDLKDAVMSLHVAAGMKAEGVFADADVNQDQHIGIPEGVFALQVAAQVREEPAELQLQRLLDNGFANADGTGATLLVWSPTMQWVGATGKSDTDPAQPRDMQPTDMLRIASMSKTFTAVTVLKLAEEGKIQPDAYLDEYLDPDTVDQITNGYDITIRHLLSMTSGIYDYSNDDEYLDVTETKPSREKWTGAEILSYVADQDASFDPGEGWEYSNTNYVLLEMIVEKTTGATLAANMRTRIFEPLGMENIFMELQEEREGGFGGLIVRGYGEGDLLPADITEENDGIGLGDGGLISDATDLGKFLMGLFSDKTLLTQTSLDMMTAFGTYVNLENLSGEAKEDAATYGLALSKLATAYGDAWGHEGKSVGFFGDMRYLKDKQTAVVLLTNYENNPNFPEELFDNVLNLVCKP